MALPDPRPLPPGWTWGKTSDDSPKLIPPAMHYGPVMTEAAAKNQGWFGPVYHGTTRARAQSIRQQGFRSPTMAAWELEDWGSIEEVLHGDTIVTWFTPNRQEAMAYADGGSVVTAYLRPGSFRRAVGIIGFPAIVVDDVKNAAVISDAKTAAKLRGGVLL